MTPTPRRPKTATRRYDLAPRTVVVHRDNHDFYEVLKAPGLPVGYYLMAPIEPSTGEVMFAFSRALTAQDVEAIAPTHPVYRLWSMRRFADLLEGRNR